MAKNGVFLPPDRPWFWIFPGQLLYTYALEKDKKSQKNSQKWLKIVQFYPLKSPETPLYEFSREYGY